ncbi:hypothetical protein C5167_034324 [Papaver somniferum]|uniref:Uncharacterized protein n=1 Tax=Papaver somniferum TaxID=3469 RepID=A0A4Y7KC44_PAPSO|nr:hypothetical protein C5167_034324 [Papaver somniferum]
MLEGFNFVTRIPCLKLTIVNHWSTKSTASRRHPKMRRKEKILKHRIYPRM